MPATTREEMIMAVWRVTYSVAVEAESEADAIAKADEGKGGGHWEAVPDDTPTTDRKLRTNPPHN